MALHFAMTSYPSVYSATIKPEMVAREILGPSRLILLDRQFAFQPTCCLCLYRHYVTNAMRGGTLKAALGSGLVYSFASKGKCQHLPHLGAPAQKSACHECAETFEALQLEDADLTLSFCDSSWPSWCHQFDHS